MTGPAEHRHIGPPVTCFPLHTPTLTDSIAPREIVLISSSTIHRPHTGPRTRQRRRKEAAASTSPAPRATASPPRPSRTDAPHRTPTSHSSPQEEEAGQDRDQQEEDTTIYRTVPRRHRTIYRYRATNSPTPRTSIPTSTTPTTTGRK